MRLRSVVSRIIPFLFALLVGIVAASVLEPDPELRPVKQVKDVELKGDGSGYGCGECGDTAASTLTFERRGTNPVRIISKRQALYTDEARTNEVEGTVRLKVTLLANGTVGSIQVVNRLPDGLTEQAIAAARKIKFEPATVNGQPVSKTITIDYSFDIY